MLLSFWTYKKYFFWLFCLLFIIFLLFWNIILAEELSVDVVGATVTDIPGLLYVQRKELIYVVFFENPASWYSVICVLSEHQTILLTELHFWEVALETLKLELPSIDMNTRLRQDYLVQIALCEYNLKVINVMLAKYSWWIFNVLKLWNLRLDLF